MSARLIDGRVFADGLKSLLAGEIRALHRQGIRPGLATVLMGADYAAAAYERRVRHLAAEMQCYYVCERFAGSVEHADALAAVGKFNADPRISGILILRPAPPQVDEVALYRTLDPVKDIEAVHPLNAGLLALGDPRYVPSTPASCFYLLDNYLRLSGRDVAGCYERSKIVVVGRSNNVGKPAILLAMARNATLVSCDQHTFAAGRLRESTLEADVLIVAAGVPGLITGADVRSGSVIIDVGINPVRDRVTGRTRLVGDVDQGSVLDKAEALTPVPGGVGPVTDVWLLNNTITAAKFAAGMEHVHPVLDGLRLAEVVRTVA